MPLAHVPAPGVPVPVEMAEAAGGPVELVWQNQAGGLTGRGAGDPGRFIKWNPVGSSESLVAEAERLQWLAGRHPAPEVVALVAAEGAELLVTRALPGRSAVDPLWVERSGDAVRAIAKGLRQLHELPVNECPFDWSVTTRIEEGRQAGIIVPESLHTPPPVDRLVVCHGDPCSPNTLLDARGNFLAHVDMGRLGVADRWADLAVATMALAWNYPEPNEALFWETYGVDADHERVAYYRALWDAT